ncbi:MAG: insulinase family protein [Erysipelotrichales bacterium]|nr:insulinase family protein [Erysipelotrichales bacterium]
MEFKTVTIGNVKVHLIKTNKFKTNIINYRYTNKIDRKKLAERSLLPQVLSAKPAFKPSKLLVNEYLEELYGASFFVNTRHHGKNSVIDFQIKVLNDKYLPGQENLLKAGLEFLKEIIINPALETDGLCKKCLRDEKRLQIDYLEAEKENKVRTAFTQLLNRMCPDETISIDKDGTKTDIRKVTSASLYKYYKQVLKNDSVDLIISGDFEFENILEFIKTEIIETTAIYQKYEPIEKLDKVISESKIIRKKEDYKQTTFVTGYRTGIYLNDELQYPLILANAILGGYMNSRLFTNIRERHSLAYSIFSFANIFSGLLFVVASLDYKQTKKALNLIENEFEDLQKNLISENEFRSIKLQVINDILELEDSQGAIVERYYNSFLLGTDMDIEKTVKKINAISKEEIRTAFNKIQQDTTFILVGDKI